MQTAITIILVLSVLIFFHELGHLIMAKRAGILCREFALGFGPKLFSFKWGETRYSIRLFPLGGYVRMAGEDPEIIDIQLGQSLGIRLNDRGEVTHLLVKEALARAEKTGTVRHIDLEEALTVTLEDEAGERTRYAVHPRAMIVDGQDEVQIAPLNRQFAGKTIGQRFWTIFAGPAMNLVLAVVFFIMAAYVYGVPSEEPVVGGVEPGTPADVSGLKEGDRIVAIDGTPVADWDDLVSKISASPNELLQLTIQRNGDTLTLPVTPASDGGRGKLGIYPEMERTAGKVVSYGFAQFWLFTKATFQGFAMLVTGGASLNDLAGPVGIFKMTGDMAAQGFGTLLIWTGLLSINLAVFNILPIPALDGGRLVFLLIEALRGKPIDPHKESMVHLIGFALLMLLMIAVTYNDVLRFFG
ncbi:MAG: RIP metalloprotease RseP [Bacillaceae bacterium G1]|mgnify:CR=1 FL=1|nr:RIP metalloprotease RseP [Bacillota bacterium]OJF17794.1 MAG: RIP metalloprotease RseP [Bacillaceae bacterium G1]